MGLVLAQNVIHGRRFLYMFRLFIILYLCFVGRPWYLNFLELAPSHCREVVIWNRLQVLLLLDLQRENVGMDHRLCLVFNLWPLYLFLSALLWTSFCILLFFWALVINSDTCEILFICYFLLREVVIEFDWLEVLFPFNLRL